MYPGVTDCCAEMGGQDSTVPDEQPADLDESLTDTDKQSCGVGAGARSSASSGSQVRRRRPGGWGAEGWGEGVGSGRVSGSLCDNVCLGGVLRQQGT